MAVFSAEGGENRIKQSFENKESNQFGVSLGMLIFTKQLLDICE